VLPAGVAVGRLNDDGVPDLAVAASGSSQIALFRGLAGGVLEAAGVVPTIDRPRRVVLLDLDSDGAGDLVVLSNTAVAVHYGQGNGQFGAASVLKQDASRNYTDVAAGDLDGDGWQDLVLADAKGQTVEWFRGKGNRELQPIEPVKVDGSPASLELADLDGDGRPDATTAHSNVASVSVLSSAGAQGLGGRTDYQSRLKALDHRAADVDGDGALDLLVLASTGIAILPGQSAAPAAPRFRRGDPDGSGQIDLTDAIAILNRLFLAGPALGCEKAADSNDDAAVDLSDAVAILGRLFLGGPALPPPGPGACGEDPTADGLACAAGC
jgi:FG-GAP-like repeat